MCNHLMVSETEVDHVAKVPEDVMEGRGAESGMREREGGVRSVRTATIHLDGVGVGFVGFNAREE